MTPQQIRESKAWELLVCGECSEIVRAEYAIDRMVKMLSHWKKAGHVSVPEFTLATWISRKVVAQ